MLRCEPFVKFKRRGESIEFDVPSCAKLATEDFQALIALLKPLAPKAAAALNQTREPAAPSQEKPTTTNEPKRKREGLPQDPKRRPEAPRPSTWRELQTLVSGFGQRMSVENRRQLLEAAKHATTSMRSVDGTSECDVLDLADCSPPDAKKLCAALAEVAESDGDVFNVRLVFAPPASVKCVLLEGFGGVWTITGRVDDLMPRRDDPPALDRAHQGVDMLLTDARARATHMQRCEALVREISSGDIYDEKTLERRCVASPWCSVSDGI